MARTRALLCPALAAALCALPPWGPARAQATLELGVRTGFALPLGGITGTEQNGTAGLGYRDAFIGFVPVALSVDLRFAHGLFAGIAAEWDAGLARSSGRGCSAGERCSGHRLHGGVELGWQLFPDARLGSWLGLGVGYEALTQLSAAGSAEASNTFTGFDAAVRAGLDLRLAPGLRFGPYLELSAGRFTGGTASLGDTSYSTDLPNRATHLLLLLGLRATWELTP